MGNASSCHFETKEKSCERPLPPPKNLGRNIPQHLKSKDAVRKVIYIDAQGVDWNNPGNTVRAAVDAGYNVILFAFYLSKQGAFDFLLVWASLSEQEQLALVDYAHSHSAILGLSAGGSTDHPYGEDPVTYATRVANFAIQNNLDLVDYDLEGISQDFVVSGTENLYAWMKSVNDTTLSLLGPNRYLTHAPQAPYFCVPNTPQGWPGPRGGYYEVYKNSPGIAWFNVQFYNQGPGYQTYETVFLDSGLIFPSSAIRQIYNSGMGIPYDKLVYGSYLQPSDGSGGIYDPERIHDAFVRAQSDLGWKAGSMVWQWATSGTPTPEQWLDTVYAEPLYYIDNNPKRIQKTPKRSDAKRTKESTKKKI